MFWLFLYFFIFSWYIKICKRKVPKLKGLISHRKLPDCVLCSVFVQLNKAALSAAPQRSRFFPLVLGITVLFGQLCTFYFLNMCCFSLKGVDFTKTYFKE